MHDLKRVLRFADFQLDVESGELHKNGLKTRLSPQALQLLVLLASRPRRVVTHDELRGLLWSEGTFVGFEHSIASAVNKLRSLIGDTARRPRFIETLPGRGYRFIGALGPTVEAVGVAVLPVANLSGDSGLDPLCDCITDALITELARDPALRVPSRQSVLRYRATSKVLGAIARELRVRSLLESGLARAGEGLRLSTRLLQVAPETHLWVGTHDLDGSLGSPDALAREIAGAVHERLA